MNRKNVTGGTLLKNYLLKKFTKIAPRTVIIFYSGIIGVFFYLENAYSGLGFWNSTFLFGAGWLTWTFLEYLLHRYLFHIDKHFPALKRLTYLLHGIHHDYPMDKARLFMPPLPGLIIAAGIFGFWYILLGEKTFAFMAGICSGYLLYSIIHFTIHSRPAKPFFHGAWSHHAKHHFKYQDKAFGVSTAFWDFIFGTMPPNSHN